MPTCTRIGCDRPSLTWWWKLCLECTCPLLGPADGVADQVEETTPQALEYAERLAPDAWGPPSPDDDWVATVRCLALASSVVARSSGCQHTLAGTDLPILVVPRATGVLRCPSCAESVLAQSYASEAGCDRCGTWAGPVSRVCLTGGAAVIVTMLCRDCAGAVREPVPSIR